jgi:hypothetical protein
LRCITATRENSVVGIHARFLATGVGPLIETIVAAGGDPGDFRTTAYEAAWSRGYDDVQVPAPSVMLAAEAFVIVSRAIDASRNASIIDTGTELWAIIARGVPPPAGARVRVSASGHVDAPWTLRVLERLCSCIRLHFDLTAASHGNGAWIENLRAELETIRETEALNRQSIEAQRRALPPLITVASIATEVDKWHRALKSRIEHEVVPTDAEREQYDRGNDRVRKSILDACTARRLERYRTELARLRDDLPTLRAERERRIAVNDRISHAIGRLEEAWTASRAVTERSMIMDRELDAIERAELPAEWLTPQAGERLPSFAELARTVGLLHALIPQRTHRMLKSR